MTEPTPIEAEFFETPHWCVHRILEAIELPDGRWLDPCVGEGAIPAAVEGVLTNFERAWWGIDIREVPGANQVMNYLVATARARFDVCIMNPPFSKALAFAQKAISHCNHVVMLQRLNWLQGPKERMSWLRAHPPAVYVLPDRPSFSGDGKTDGGGYAWYYWGPNVQWPAFNGLHILADTPQSEIKAARFPTVKRQTSLQL